MWGGKKPSAARALPPSTGHIGGAQRTQLDIGQVLQGLVGSTEDAAGQPGLTTCPPPWVPVVPEPGSHLSRPSAHTCQPVCPLPPVAASPAFEAEVGALQAWRGLQLQKAWHAGISREWEAQGWEAAGETPGETGGSPGQLQASSGTTG